MDSEKEFADQIERATTKMKKPRIDNVDEKPKKTEYAMLGGFKVDISFIPTGIAIPFLRAYDEWVEMTQEHSEDELRENSELAEKNIYKQVDVIAVFTEFKDEKMDRDWILRNTDLQEVGIFLSSLMKAVYQPALDKLKKTEKKTKSSGKKSSVKSA